MTTDHASNPIPTGRFNGLAYLGLTPFLLGLAMEALQISFVGVDGRFWFTAYSSVILSFLCGIWWGGALNRPGHRFRAWLMLLSNLVSLVGWLALLLYRTPVALPVLALCFLFVVRVEAQLKPNIAQLTAYFKTRSRVSYLVIACHVLMMFLLWW